MSQLITCRVCKTEFPPHLWKTHTCRYNPEPINREPYTVGEQASKAWNEFFNSDTYKILISSLSLTHGVPETLAADHIYTIFIQGWLARVRELNKELNHDAPQKD